MASNMKNPGKVLPHLISFEGIDCAGKTHNLTKVALPTIDSWLSTFSGKFKGKGILANSWTPDVGLPIRKIITGQTLNDPVLEMLLLFARHRHLLTQEIYPNIEKGNVVLVDRWVATTIAYQGLTREHMSLWSDLFSRTVDLAIPGLTVFLEVSPEESRRRILTRPSSVPLGVTDTADSMEDVDLNVLSARNDRYRAALTLGDGLSNAHCITVDANQPIEIVELRVKNAIEEHLCRLAVLNECENFNEQQ